MLTRAAMMVSRWFSSNTLVVLADIDYELGEGSEIGGLPALRRAWQKLGRDMARCRPEIVGADGYTVGAEHPGLRLLTRNTGTAGLSSMRWRLWEAVTAQQYGNAYTLIHRLSDGTPYRLEPIAPGQVETIVNETGVYYLVNQQPVDESNLIVQQWDIDPAMPFAGSAPKDTCRDALRTETTRATGYRRVVNTGMVGKWGVTKENAVTPGVRAEMTAKWLETHTPKTIDQPAVFQEGLKPSPLIPDAAARYLDARREGVKDTALVTDVPPALLYEQDGRAMGEVFQLYAADVSAILELFADEYTRKLCRIGESVQIGTGPLNMADFRTGFRGVAMAYERGIMTRNEARERLGGLAPDPAAESDEFSVLISGVTGQDQEQNADGENGGNQ